MAIEICFLERGGAIVDGGANVGGGSVAPAVDGCRARPAKPRWRVGFRSPVAARGEQRRQDLDGGSGPRSRNWVEMGGGQGYGSSHVRVSIFVVPCCP